MYCGYCGVENPDQARFCRKCGKPIRFLKHTAAWPVAPSDVEPYTDPMRETREKHTLVRAGPDGPIHIPVSDGVNRQSREEIGAEEAQSSFRETFAKVCAQKEKKTELPVLELKARRADQDASRMPVLDLEAKDVKPAAAVPVLDLTEKHHTVDLLQKPQQPVCVPQPDAKWVSKENAPLQEPDEQVAPPLPIKPGLEKEVTGSEPMRSNQTTFINTTQVLDDVAEDEASKEQDEANEFGEHRLCLPAWVLMVFTMLRLHLTKAFHTTVLRASAAIVYLEQRRKENRPKAQEKAKPTNTVCEAPMPAPVADEEVIGQKTWTKANKARAHKRMVSHIFKRHGKQVGDPGWTGALPIAHTEHPVSQDAEELSDTEHAGGSTAIRRKEPFAGAAFEMSGSGAAAASPVQPIALIQYIFDTSLKDDDPASWGETPENMEKKHGNPDINRKKVLIMLLAVGVSIALIYFVLVFMYPSKGGSIFG